MFKKIALIFILLFILTINSRGVLNISASASETPQVSLSINLDKSPSYSVKSDTWFYDNLETVNAEVVVTNFSQKNLEIESKNCIDFKVKDKNGMPLITNGNNTNDFCVGITDSQNRKFVIEPFREYYFYLEISIATLNPGFYTLNVNLGDSQISAERSFYVIDTDDKCLAIPKISDNKIVCPFTETTDAKNNLELTLNLENGYVSKEDSKINDVNLNINNKSDQTVRFAFLDNCLEASISNETTSTSEKFNPSICISNYINIESGFLKSKKIKVLELKPNEIKPILSNSATPDIDSFLPLPVKNMENGQYDLKINLPQSSIESASAKIQIMNCESGYTVNKDGACFSNPKQFYQDKILFDINFEKIPSTLGETFKAYVDLRNLTDKDIKIDIPTKECFAFSLYQQKDLSIEQIDTLKYEISSPDICKPNPNDENSSILSLPAKSEYTITVSLTPDNFPAFKQNASLDTKNFMIEGKIQGDVRTKLKNFSLNNYVKKTKNCGGDFNLLCEDKDLICSKDNKCVVKLPDEYYFTDTEDHFAKDYIEQLRTMGIIEGFANREFKPNQEITRAEFTKIIIKALKIELIPRDQSNFSDVKITDWYSPYIETAKEKEIIEGYRDSNGYLINEFKPLSPINRAEAVKIIVKSLNIKEFTTTKFSFSDVKDGDWYYKYLFTAYNSKSQLIEGFSDNTFKPSSSLTRGEATKIIMMGIEENDKF